MLYKVHLKNADEVVILDEQGYKFLTTEPHCKKIDLINNLRRHSSGCAVFQKTHAHPEGGYYIETIYLHKLLAEKYLGRQKSGDKRLVGTKNGNKLDCRIDNLEFRSRSTASRKRRSSSSTGFTGVYKENGRYRAVISFNRKSIHIGMFDTPEEAAKAYNAKSIELYGPEGKINLLPGMNESDLMVKKKPKTVKSGETKKPRATVSRKK